MQTITTYFLGPTDYRPSRVVAKSAAGHKITLSWEHALNPEKNHGAAALALMAKLKWTGELVAGDNEDGSMSWVFLNDVASRVSREEHV